MATTGQNFKGDHGPSKLEGTVAMISELQQEETLRELCGGPQGIPHQEGLLPETSVSFWCEEGSMAEDHCFSLRHRNARGNGCLRRKRSPWPSQSHVNSRRGHFLGARHADSPVYCLFRLVPAASRLILPKIPLALGYSPADEPLIALHFPLQQIQILGWLHDLGHLT